MTLGLAKCQGELFSVAVQQCEAELPERSIYRLLHAERDRLFADELFAYDLRWRYAAGVDDETSSFAQTVLVELHTRVRLWRSGTGIPGHDRAGRSGELVGVRRVLDSAPLF
jgi:hypothetical protein